MENELDDIAVIQILPDRVVIETREGKKLVIGRYVFDNIKRDVSKITTATARFKPCTGCGS